MDRFRHRAIIALEAAPGGLGKQTHRPTILKGGFGPPFLQADGSFPRVERHKEIVVLPFSRFQQAGHEDRCRPPPSSCGGKWGGRRRRVECGLRARRHATGRMPENTPFEHSQRRMPT